MMARWLYVLGFLGACYSIFAEKYENHTLLRIYPLNESQLEAVHQFTLDKAEKVEILKPSRGLNDSMDVLVAPEQMEMVQNFSRDNELTITHKKENYLRYKAAIKTELRWFTTTAAMIGREDREDALLKSALQVDERVRVVSEHLTECLMLLEETPNPEDREMVEGDVSQCLELAQDIEQAAADITRRRDGKEKPFRGKAVRPVAVNTNHNARYGPPRENLPPSQCRGQRTRATGFASGGLRLYLGQHSASPPAERNGRSIRAAPWGKSSDHLPTYEDLKSFLEAESRRVDVQAGEAPRKETSAPRHPERPGAPARGGNSRQPRRYNTALESGCAYCRRQATGCECPSNTNCRYCQGAHHPLLCMNRSGDAGAALDRVSEGACPPRGSNAPHPSRRSPPPHRSQGQAGDVNRRSPLTQDVGTIPTTAAGAGLGRTAQERGQGHPSQVRDPTGGCQESTRQPPGYMQYSAGLSHLVGSQDPRMPPPMPEYPRLQAQPRYGRLPLGYYRAPAMAFMGRPPTSRSGTHTQDLPEGDTVLYGSVLSEVLQRFWESEEPPTADRRKPEDDECELFYQYNTARCPSGRFVTRLPFLPNRPALGLAQVCDHLTRDCAHRDTPQVSPIGGMMLEAPSNESAPRRRAMRLNPAFEYKSYNAILTLLDNLAKSYPKLLTLQPLGTSYEGRQMLLAKISSNPAARNPIIFVDAGIHAREWVAPAMAVYMIHRLVTDPGAQKDLEGIDWYILPVVNPDGYEYTRRGGSNRMWRKTRSKNGNCFGVDGNRNYGFKWGVSGVSMDPCNKETYAGPTAFSEKETQMVKRVMVENSDRIKLYVSMHAYGQYLVYPWGYTGDRLPKQWKKLDRLAKITSEAVVRAGGQPFRVLSAGKWYAAAGGSDDFAFGAIGVPYSYTMELTDGHEFVFPEGLLPSVLPKFYEGFRAMGREIRKEFPNRRSIYH
ncbi:zinc carboxypeptidase domain-containing protein [Phthorimaea operculella]|nr:zinc carboxypeptidase domain-containing protein [Phthorimaea operculella]